MQPNELIEFFGEPISVYTRVQAIEDGVLIDITYQAKKFGFRHPVALTDTAMTTIMKKCGQSKLDPNTNFDVICLVSILKTLKEAIRLHVGDSNIILFEVTISHPLLRTEVRQSMKSHLGGGDDGEPVITLMLPNED